MLNGIKNLAKNAFASAALGAAALTMTVAPGQESTAQADIVQITTEHQIVSGTASDLLALGAHTVRTDILINTTDFDIFDQQVSGNNSSLTLRLNDIDAKTVVLDTNNNQLASGSADSAIVHIVNGNLGAITQGQFTFMNITEGNRHLTGAIDDIILAIDDTNTGITEASLDNYLNHGLNGGFEGDDAFNTFEHWNLNGNRGVLSDGSQSVTFSTANSVPEPSSTAVLVGLGILLAAPRRRGLNLG